MTENHTILVTGGCGYLGSILIRELTGEDSGGQPTIRILDNMSSGNVRALMDLPRNAQHEFIDGDILNPSMLRLALDGVDSVIHLAAVVRTPLSFDNPAWMEQVNHWGTTNLVEACLHAGVERLIFASSTAVYGPGGPWTESDVCQPQGAYAQSKYAAEKSVEVAASRGLKACVLRLGSLYGMAPSMRFDAVANRMAFLAGVGQTLTVYGSGEQCRPIVHVRDASAAIQMALSQLDGQPFALYNVVQESVSIVELVDVIRSIRPTATVRFTEQDIRTHYSFEVRADSLRETGWEPVWSLREGYEEMLEHFTGLTPVIAVGDELEEI